MKDPCSQRVRVHHCIETFSSTDQDCGSSSRIHQTMQATHFELGELPQLPREEIVTQ